MARRLGIDYESFSPVDLKVHGLDRYSAHPETEVLMAAYRIDDGPLRHWDATVDPTIPADLKDALLDPECEKWAFNAQFERVITRRVLKIKTPTRGWRCTMVAAYMLSFTGGLDDVAAQMGLDTRKDADGKRLIRLFSLPQKPTKVQALTRLTKRERPEDWARFVEYNKQDVLTEEAIRDWALPYLKHNSRLAWEWHLYEIDQTINDRGKPVDLVFSRNALEMAERRKAELIDEMKRVTGVANPGSTAQLLPWLRDRGYPFADLQKHTVKKVLAEAGDELAPEAVEALKLRQWASRTSTKKHTALLNVADEERSVVRFLYQFGGASRTNRWAGRKVQTQNLPGTPKVIEDYAKLLHTTALIRWGDYDALALWMGEPMEALVGTVRSAFSTQDGEVFSVCDLSSIESCVIGWIANCVRLLQVFRDGKDPYKDFAQELYEVAYEAVTKQQRTGAKPAMLGAGYRLGGGELRDGKKTGLWRYAEDMGIPLTREQCHEAVAKFREVYWEIPKLWYDLEDAAARALETGIEQRVRYLRFKRVGEFLLMILPSGRPIYYHKPRMVQRYWEDGSPRSKLSFTYMGQDQKTGQWTRLENHGGRFTEQSVQGTARDVLAEGIKEAHRRGFDIRGHVHDEIITVRDESDEARGVDALRECMVRPLAWAPGLPLKAEGWSGRIYRK